MGTAMRVTGCLRTVAASGLAVSMMALSPGMAGAAPKWQNGPSGPGKASASLYSSNVLTTGTRAIDFHPLLTLSCDSSRPGVWRQSVRIHEPIASDPPVEVRVRIDQGGLETQSWSLGQKNRALVLDGPQAMARLRQASRLRVAWQDGFFGGDGEGVFDMRGAGDVIARLAEACGVGLPAR